MRSFAFAISIGCVSALAVSADARKSRFASEVHVEQARGRVSSGIKPLGSMKPASGTPEGAAGANGAAKGSPTIPTTCNQQNASSPACYSATQQARPTGK
jgi:hypothetical protein